MFANHAVVPYVILERRNSETIPVEKVFSPNDEILL
jgi:hypothetical protein